MRTHDENELRQPARRIGRRHLLAVAAGLLLANGLPHAQVAGASDSDAGRAVAWSGTWGAAQVFALAPPTFPVLQNLTIRQTARVSLGGDVFRVRLSNETGTAEIAIGAARIALAGTGGAIQARSDRALTFGGKSSIVLRAGAPVVSDPVRLRVDDLDTLSVSIYLPGTVSPVSGHLTATSTTYISAAGSGNATAAVAFPTSTTTTSSFLLSRIDVAANADAVIVAFGDSITDGFASTVDANRRWPDVLAERLDRAHQRAGVVNAGISGNRVLHDQPNALFGPGALARFDRDVLAVPGVTHATLLEGINDIGQPGTLGGIQQVTADEIIDGYKQLIARAHEHGIKIIGGTLTPFAVTTIPDYFTPEGEVKRQAVNHFVRTSGLFDGVIDFDAAIRDPADPSRVAARFDSGDHLHPSDAGYRAMGEAVDLRLFR
jgi:lysophospholipase L1-like esterase